MIRHDKKDRLRFTPLQSAAGQRILKEHDLPLADFDSFIMIDKGKLYKKSTAALRIYNKLPWYWKWTQLFWIFPRFIRDAIYSIIANNRYRWFGKKDACMIPGPGVRQKFLED